MKIDGKTSVGNVVGENFKTAKLFESKGIDFCCGGNQTLASACQENKIEMESFIQEIQELMMESDPETEFIKRLELDELVDYIIKRHHSFVLEQIPEISQLVNKIASVHGDAHPETHTIKSEFDEAAIKLNSHLKDEEEKLFPYIKMMVGLKNKNGSLEQGQKFSLKALLNGLIDEHTTEGERFDNLAKLTNNFAIPEGVCNTYLVTYKKLKAFQDDLHRHVHLENNMVYPMAVELETDLLKGE